MTGQTRRRGRWLTGPGPALLIAAATLWQGAGGRAAENPVVEADAGRMITPAAEKAIENGLRYLAQAQHEDGSFASGGYRGNVAICGLAGLAFMAGGSTPNRGRTAESPGGPISHPGKRIHHGWGP